MAKKKKTALKPVARGFATTSVPKKVEPQDEPEPEPTPLVDEVTATSNEAQAQDTGTGSALPGTASLTPEDQLLQDLVDKLQEKTEKEIVRALKTVETDRRFSLTMPPLDLDSTYVEQIISLMQSEPETDEPSGVEGSEDKAIAKLGITYGTLRRLGFTESRVEECLRSIRGISLEEAFEWLYMHCSEEELMPAKVQDTSELKAPRTPRGPTAEGKGVLSTHAVKPNRNRSQTNDDNDKTRQTQRPSASPLDASAPSFVPKTAIMDATLRSGSAGSETPMTMSSLNSERASPDSDDPHAEYVRLKIEIDSMTTHRTAQEDREASHLILLKRRLASVQDHYFFRQDEADELYKTARQDLDAKTLQARLRGEAPALSSKKKRPTRLAEPSPPSADSEDSDEPGGMLDILETLQESVVDGKTVPVRDMGTSKQWSGRTPKVLLSETVRKVDRRAVISYRNISGNSRAQRMSVDVRANGGKEGTWTMDDVACTTEAQAEQYISVVALHALTYPALEGFAAGVTSAAGGGQTFFRLLPAVFRDLWDELEEKRRQEDDHINRSAWSKLRTVLDAKLRNTKMHDSKSALTATQERNYGSRFMNVNQDASPEQLIAGYIARVNSPAYQHMLAQRNSLPIAAYRNEIVLALETSQVLVLSGETGCGKSTQLPAFILEDQLSQGKHCKIFCTEPRRISAISLAQRVAAELGDPPGSAGTNGSIVGYSVRLESNISRSTRLAYVTNGIALRMLESGSGSNGQGSAFDEITHIIIDEVHERTIESDFLLIVLKSLMFQRPDLRIVLMSATVDAEKISQYFGGCPTMHVPGRTFPVDTRYLEDAVELTKWSVSEGSQYARRTNDKFYRNKNRPEWAEEAAAADEDDPELPQQDIKLEKRYSDKTASTLNIFDERQIPYELILRLLECICFEDPSYLSYSAAILIFMPGLGEIRRLNDMLLEHALFGDMSSFWVMPLHSTVSSENQGAVFDVPPHGMRKIVIATNIAETGITIPDITCVIDTGKHREMRFDEKRQLSRLVETFVAKSNAAQRRGRAGRVQNGLCFHLFTKVRHDVMMSDHPQPEMMRLSLSDLALRIKIMKVQIGTSIEDVLSRALDAPSSINIQRAVSALVEVQALTPNEDITPMGRLLSKLPTDVHLGKFLLIATVFKCLDPALTIAATLNAKSPFVVPFGKEDAADAAKLGFKIENSDFLTLHNVFSAWRRASANGNQVHKFCRQNFLSPQNLQQIEELRQQFLGYLVDASFIQVDHGFARDLSRARYNRGRTRLVHVPEYLNSNSTNTHIVNAALVAGLYPKVLAVDPAAGQMRTIANNQVAYFHPTSVNRGRKPQDLGVHYLSYFTLMQSKRMYVWETSPVDDIAMFLLCGDCEFKYIADFVSIDRKIRFRMPGRTAMALKHLRKHLATVLSLQFRSQPLTESQVLWKELAEMVLSKVKPAVEEKSSLGVRIA